MSGKTKDATKRRLDLQRAIENLTSGRELPTEGHADRRKQLVRLVEKYLPDFVQKTTVDQDVVAFHQDAFAAGYHADEYALLGMWIKYVGLKFGVTIMITGKNGSTFKELE